MDKLKVVLAEYDGALSRQFSEIVNMEEELEFTGMANNGVDAWDLIVHTQPDIVVMELLLPYMDGLALLDKIKKSNQLLKKPQIVVTSTMSNEAIIKETFKMGINYFAIKPYDIQFIVKRIKMLGVSDTDFSSNLAIDEESIISNHLNILGIPASLKGYSYIITAVKEVTKDPSMVYGITKILYPSIAKKHNSTAARVEKAIRHAIEVAWIRCSEEELRQYTGNACSKGSKRPTNSEFIALLARKVRSLA